ncbi:hypothetical protein D3C79_737220 [compost metagenome]
MHRPQQQRRAADGDWRVAFAEHREVEPQGAEQQHEVADVAQPGADPVAPGRRKAHVIAKAGLGVGIHPGIQLGFAVGQGLEHEGQGQHAHRCDPPADQYRADVGTCGHVLRQRKNPTADHRADHQGDQRTQAQFLSRFGHADPLLSRVCNARGTP